MPFNKVLQPTQNASALLTLRRIYPLGVTPGLNYPVMDVTLVSHGILSV
jgi:hypothetical protein